MTRPLLLVISSNYPGPNNTYGDVFVHTRVKEYKKEFDVSVVGYNAHQKTRERYEYEGVDVCLTNHLEDFGNTIRSLNPDLVIVHFIQHPYMDFLRNLGKPLAVFIHGYEALSWKRRLMNYRSLGSLRYLWTYFLENTEQRRALKKFAEALEGRKDVSFVMVSNWLKRVAEEDLGLLLKNSMTIPNGIDTSLFNGGAKRPELRKKILLIRSFKANNYANDLSIGAIMELSKKPYFQELEFCIYGHGYLFGELTDKVKHFKNVTLNNFFVQNTEIPYIHKQYGIFLCPSRLDTQGVSMCEAMASGLVAIASPIGGIPEYATHDESALLVSDVDGIVKSIDHLYKNPDDFLRISAGARKAIVEKCSLKDTTRKEMSLFESLLQSQTAGEVSTFREGYRQCTRCVLDTKDDPAITFDELGVCSYCRLYGEIEKKLKKGDAARHHLVKSVNEIKAAGAGKPYDCILGLSGGVDSTYLAYICKKLGLRPLAVHFDNGWNSELAVSNIEKIVTILEIPLHTFVVDWDEFKDLQLSVLKASVVDIEMITDHAIITKLYDLALEHNIKYVLSGTNVVTESILPGRWIHNKKDHVNIRNIHRRFGKRPIRTFPLFNSFRKLKVAWRGIQSVSLLDYMPYEKKEVKKVITQELGWRDYGGKHYESIFTRFYQGYILPHKFGIDKRRAHLSNLICSGQITREEALAELEQPAYPEEFFRTDYDFVLKKLDLTDQEFQQIMQLPIHQHADYGVEKSLSERFPVTRFMRPVWRWLKGLKNGF